MNVSTTNLKKIIIPLLALVAVGAFLLLQKGPEVRPDPERASVLESVEDLESLDREESEEGQTRFKYAEITNSCDHNYESEEGEECVKAYSGPSKESSEVARLRTNMVLKIGNEITNGNELWYKITFDDQWLRYPERLESQWFVPADSVNIIPGEGTKTTWEDGNATSTSKQIVVDKAAQMLYAYEGDKLYMETPLSTGLLLSPTPNGSFTIFKKTPNRYMQGPIQGIPGSDYYDLPGVPWNLYFTENGAVIHGAYWHNNFGNRHSHGCVNLPPQEAKKLYNWATLGTEVVVK